MNATDSSTHKTRASTVEDWSTYHSNRDCVHTETNVQDFRNRPHALTLAALQQYYPGGSLIEIGAGSSSLLIDACRLLRPTECVGLDYLESACKNLELRAKSAGDVQIDARCADLFEPPSDLLNRFDFVVSFGVVEHFHDLPGVLKAISRFAKPGGTIFTLIPNNKNTIYGTLMKKWNIDVYQAHVMYDKDDLVGAHKSAAVNVVACDYLISTNFGMLSWCFSKRQAGFNYWLYKQLTRVSKLVWLFESKIKPLKPKSRFSPFIFCVSKRPQ